MASPTFEPWVLRALAKWPNVPALYGWLSLDRRGRWRIRGEVISRPQIIDTIAANYAHDERGAWFFQNGPQRGFVDLEYAPLVLRRAADGALVTHTGRRVEAPRAAFLDEDGALVIDSEHGAGVVEQDDLAAMLPQVTAAGAAASDEALLSALQRPSGAPTGLSLELGSHRLPLSRLDSHAMPAALGFLRTPRAP